MVAEAAKVTSKREKRLTPKIPLATRTQARNLYVLHQLGAPEVAKQTGLSESQIYSLSHREGWTKVRAKIRENSLSDANARMSEDAAEMVEAIAIKSSVLSLGTLDGAIEELKTPGEFQAKNLQALSVAAKNFVGLYRQAKQLDQANDANAGGTVNVMFIGSGNLTRSAERITRNVTPSQSASPSPATQDSAACIDVAATQSSAPSTKASSAQP